MLSTPPPICVEDAELRPRVRREAGRLLAAQWGSAWRQQGFAGAHPPAFRILAHNNAGHLIAHASAFALATEPAIELYGIGDLVVKPRYRRRGLARVVCETLVARCRERGAQEILVDTLAARDVFAALGFRAVEGFEFFYLGEDRCVRHRHWMVGGGERRAGAIEILAHGDF